MVADAGLYPRAYAREAMGVSGDPVLRHRTTAPNPALGQLNELPEQNRRFWLPAETIRSLSQRPPLLYGRNQDSQLSATIAFNCREVGNQGRLEMAPTGEMSIKRTIRRQQLHEMVPLAGSTI
jgi:hypothetical protein